MSRLYLLAPRRDLFRRTARIKGIATANLIGYWPLAEAGGTVAIDESGAGRNGAYTAVTLAQSGTGDGRTSASFDGSTSYASLQSVSLTNAFNGAEGGLIGWVRIPTEATYADGVSRTIVVFLVNSSNRVVFDKPSTGGLRCRYIAGGTTESISITTTSLAWQFMALTWSKAADEVKAYLGSVQQGSTQTGLGVFAGSLASVTIGAADTTPTLVMSGNIAHVALWDTPLSAAQIAVLAGG